MAQQPLGLIQSKANRFACSGNHDSTILWFTSTPFSPRRPSSASCVRPAPLLSHSAQALLWSGVSSRPASSPHGAAKTGCLFACLLPGLQHLVKRLPSARRVSMWKSLLNTNLVAEHCQEPVSLSPPRWKGRINGFMKTVKSNSNYTNWQPAATAA